MKICKTIVLSIDEVRNLVIKQYEDIFPNVSCLLDEDYVALFHKVQISKQIADDNQAECLIIENVSGNTVVLNKGNIQ